MFHHFHDRRHPQGQGSITAEQFDSLIKFVGRKRILSAEEWSARAATGALSPTDLCITFDDTLRCQFDIAVPVLKAHDIRPFWFVYTSIMQGNLEWLEVYRHFRTTRYPDVEEFYREFDETLREGPFATEVSAALQSFDSKTYLKGFDFYSDGDRKFRFLRDKVLKPERYDATMRLMLKRARYDASKEADSLWMSAAQLRDLRAQGHLIGLHSHSHPTAMASLAPEAQEREYRLNFDFLSQLLGEKPISMSHPCNSYNSDTLEILRRMGIRFGFRANMQLVEKYSLLELPREDHTNIMKRMAEA